MKAEYRALHHITKLTWLKILSGELGTIQKKQQCFFVKTQQLLSLPKIQFSMIDQAQDNLDSGVWLRFFILKELVNIITNVVTSGLFHMSLSKLSMCDIYHHLKGES